MNNPSLERRVRVTIEYRLRANTEADLDMAEKSLNEHVHGWIRSFPTGVFQPKYEYLGYPEGYWPELKSLLLVEKSGHEKAFKNPTWVDIKSQLEQASADTSCSLQRGSVRLTLSSAASGLLMIGADCQHGWRNLLYSESPDMVEMVIGGQRASYPVTSCTPLGVALQIAKTFLDTGLLDPAFKWDNPPKE